MCRSLTFVFLFISLLNLSACGGGGDSGNSLANDPVKQTTPVQLPSTNPSTPLGPNNLGQSANADGYYPDAAGFYPNAQGIYPDKNGVYPSPEAYGLFANELGVARHLSTAGAIDKDNPFFKPFGNGRSCASCHQQAQGFSITPQELQNRFDTSKGNDPIFSLNDGANSPLATFSNLDQKRLAYSMLLNKGLIRIGMKIPANAEFELLKAEDPYQYASENELSLFRRPLPSANLKFLSDVMWDGRETARDINTKDCLPQLGCFAALETNLMHQANSATLGHAQAARDLSLAEQKSIVDFEKTLFSAQVFDQDARFLDSANGQGGPVFLQNTNFYFGINDLILGDIRTGAAYTRNTMKNFSAWLNNPGTTDAKVDAKRRSIARGEVLFNTRTFNPRNLTNIPIDLKISLNRVTCSSCHNTPQAGGASTPLAVSIFTDDSGLRTPDLPLYTLRNKITGAVMKTMDPGIAMQSGKWEDIGRFKVPSLRGLASRAPYFHNGSAETLFDVVSHYDTTFAMFLTGQELADLVAFLGAL